MPRAPVPKWVKARMSRGLVMTLALTSPLHAENADEEEIEITVAGQREVSLRDPTSASQVIYGERLLQPGASAATVLDQVPGVEVTKTGASSDVATASLRGATSAQTPVYLAGIRLNDDVSGTADLSTLPLWMLDRIEVYRGHAPQYADRLGLGGAVFFEPRLPEATGARAGASVGSFGERAVFIGATAAAPRGGVMLALRTDTADNDYPFVDDRGTRLTTADDRVIDRPNADFTAYDLWALGRGELGRTAHGSVRFTALGNFYAREQGVTGFAVAPAESARQKLRRFLGGLSTHLPCQASVPDGCRVRLDSTLIAVHSELEDPARELGILTDRAVSDATRVSQHQRFERFLSESLFVELSTGQEFERLELDQTDSMIRANRLTLDSSGALELALSESFLFDAVGKLSCYGTEGPEQAQNCSALSPEGRVGARFGLDERLALLANFGRYERQPTLGELYGVAPAVRGNPEIMPETGISADVGVRASLAGSRELKLFVQLFAFGRHTAHLIAYRRGGLGYLRPFNVGKARILGLEGSVVLQLPGRLSSRTGADLIDPRDTTEDRAVSNDLIPFHSRVRLSERLEWPLPLPTRGNEPAQVHSSLGGQVAYASSKVADPAGLIVIDEQATVDGFYTLQLGKEGVTMRAAVTNILDAPHFDVIGFPLPGRSVHLSFEAVLQ